MLSSADKVVGGCFDRVERYAPILSFALGFGYSKVIAAKKTCAQAAAVRRPRVRRCCVPTRRATTAPERAARGLHALQTAADADVRRPRKAHLPAGSGIPPNPTNGLVPDHYPTEPFASDRRGRFRPDGVRRRRRARLHHARAGGGAHAGHAAFLPRRAAEGRSEAADRLPRLLLSLPRHEDRRARRAGSSSRRSIRRCCSAASCSRRPTSTTTRRRRSEIRQLADDDLPSRRVDMGAGARAADHHGLDPGAGRSSRTTGRATTKACSSTCWRSARRPSRSATRRLAGLDEELRRDAGAASSGQSTSNFAPLFGHQYSHIWIDFRGIQDA